MTGGLCGRLLARVTSVYLRKSFLWLTLMVDIDSNAKAECLANSTEFSIYFDQVDDGGFGPIRAEDLTPPGRMSDTAPPPPNGERFTGFRFENLLACTFIYLFIIQSILRWFGVFRLSALRFEGACVV